MIDTIEDISDKLGQSTRALFRAMRDLQEAGFMSKSKLKNRIYCIPNEMYDSCNKLFTFIKKFNN